MKLFTVPVKLFLLWSWALYSCSIDIFNFLSNGILIVLFTNI